MPITDLAVHNYKSLRNVSMPMRPFMTFVGANASGKSNLVDALHFLSETYRLGLEVAIARKGGYENICFRRARRSKAPVKINVTARIGRPIPFFPSTLAGTLIVKHEFEVQAKGESISADFMVKSEGLSVEFRPPTRRGQTSPIQPNLFRTNETRHSRSQVQLLKIDRRGILVNVETPDIGVLHENYQGIESFDRLIRPLERLVSWGSTIEVGEAELSITQLSRLFMPLTSFPRLMSDIRVYQLSPGVCRLSGVPTPNPELDRYGENLPAMLDFLKKHHNDAYLNVRKYLREIIPSLDDVEVTYTHRKTLTVGFKEHEVSRSWPIEDVSDGTVQVLAILTALFDPRIRFIAIEEPENSVHPWIVRSLANAAREASKDKQVILTTHSPVLIESLTPNELWIVHKRHGETNVRQASSLDDTMSVVWESGEVSLFDYIDSGAIPAAVPGEPEEISYDKGEETES